MGRKVGVSSVAYGMHESNDEYESQMEVMSMNIIDGIVYSLPLIKWDADTGSGGAGSLDDLNGLGADESHADEEQHDEVETFDLDAFKEFAETHPDARAYIDSITQKRVDKGVQTMFEKQREQIEQEAILKAQNQTPQEREIAEIKRQMRQMKEEKQRSDNRAVVLQEINELDVDSTIKPYVQNFALDLVDVDSERTTERMRNFTQLIEKLGESTQRENTRKSVEQITRTREQSKPSESVQQDKYTDPTQLGKQAIGRAMFGK